MLITLKIVVILSSIIMIISVLLQESKSDGLSSAISGGAEQLFGKRRSQGYDSILHKITIISSVVFFISSILGSVL